MKLVLLFFLALALLKARIGTVESYEHPEGDEKGCDLTSRRLVGSKFRLSSKKPSHNHKGAKGKKPEGCAPLKIVTEEVTKYKFLSKTLFVHHNALISKLVFMDLEDHILCEDPIHHCHLPHHRSHLNDQYLNNHLLPSGLPDHHHRQHQDCHQGRT